MTAQKSTRPQAGYRSDFARFVPISTRWMDNDIYGHVNNVVYYSFFDTAVNQFLVEQGALDIHTGTSIGLVVHSECDYFEPLAFPGKVDAGLRVTAVGSSSINYEIGLFAEDAPRTAARGRFVHVYVDRETRRPASLPDVLRRVVAELQSPLSST